MIALEYLAVVFIHRDLVATVTQQVTVNDDWVVWVTNVIGQQHSRLIIRRLCDFEGGTVCVPVQARVLDDLVSDSPDPIHIDAMRMPGVHLCAKGCTDALIIEKRNCNFAGIVTPTHRQSGSRRTRRQPDGQADQRIKANIGWEVLARWFFRLVADLFFLRLRRPVEPWLFDIHMGSDIVVTIKYGDPGKAAAFVAGDPDVGLRRDHNLMGFVKQSGNQSRLPSVLIFGNQHLVYGVSWRSGRRGRHARAEYQQGTGTAQHAALNS